MTYIIWLGIFRELLILVGLAGAIGIPSILILVFLVLIYLGISTEEITYSKGISYVFSIFRYAVTIASAIFFFLYRFFI